MAEPSGAEAAEEGFLSGGRVLVVQRWLVVVGGVVLGVLGVIEVVVEVVVEVGDGGGVEVADGDGL